MAHVRRVVLSVRMAVLGPHVRMSHVHTPLSAGSGWGAMSFIKAMSKDDAEVRSHNACYRRALHAFDACSISNMGKEPASVRHC